MKINELVKVGEKIEKKTIHHDEEYNEKGELIAQEYDEEIEITIPIMKSIIRDMTDEEIAEMERMNAEIPLEEPTQLDRIEAQMMYTALMTDTLIEGEVK